MLSDIGISAVQLNPVCGAFIQNLATLEGVARILPIAASRMTMLETEILATVDVMLSNPHLLAEFKSGEAPEFNQALGKYLKQKFTDTDAIAKRIVYFSEQLLEEKLDRFSLSDQLAAVEKTFVSQLWAAFENVAKDAWVAAINNASSSTKASAFAGFDPNKEDEGFTRKMVSVGMLAKHGFNLQGCAGDILADRYDFTGVAGIIKAFGALGDRSLANSPHVETLSDLESIRHVIVHRCGIVDAIYANKSGRYPANQPVWFSVDQLNNYVLAVRESGIALLKIADRVVA